MPLITVLRSIVLSLFDPVDPVGLRGRNDHANAGPRGRAALPHETGAIAIGLGTEPVRNRPPRRLDA
jgi:hypothetical protein